MKLAALLAVGAAAPLLAHIAYVAFLPALARRFGRPWRRGPFRGRLAILVPARDEEATIGDKLRNIFADGSLPEGTKVVVIADGCTDGTSRVALASGRVRVVEFPDSRGKAARFNEIVPELDVDLVAFTDATARWAPGTVGRLLEPFADPEVGGVGATLSYSRSGELPGTGGTEVAAGTREYFDLEARVRQAESLLASSTGFSGSLYAMRHELYRPLSSGANEDFQAALDVAAAGKRAVVTDVEVLDDSHRDWGAELRMRRRVIGRALRAIVRSLPLLPRRPVFALMLFVHKVVRFLAWALALAAMTCGIVALGGGTTRAVLAILLLLGAGGVEALLAFRFAGALEGGGAGRRAIRRVAHLLLAQLAAALALLDFVTGRVPAGWKPERAGGNG